ncbi:YD repeat-containing protein [Pseudomonas graminis]|uniref:YD repeat-containing protein n=1 Tax=Pseudomonas graminis TaxID=158627 RepID=A0A1I0I329_9PSED|nr:YD repeat-containing protein [Pseudomonas graminis]
MLCLALEVYWCEDRLVIAIRDYGGERYAMGLDEAGNPIGITLPDGSNLAFKYDDFSRLTEETYPLGRKSRYKDHLGTTLEIESRSPTVVFGLCLQIRWSTARCIALARTGMTA